MGNVHHDVGDDSVVLGATDAHGNANYTMEGAFGAHANAGPGSLAIGYGASAGASFPPARAPAYTVTSASARFGLGAVTPLKRDETDA